MNLYMEVNVNMDELKKFISLKMFNHPVSNIMEYCKPIGFGTDFAVSIHKNYIAKVTIGEMYILPSTGEFIKRTHNGTIIIRI